MSLEFLPQEIEDIIYNYKHQMEFTEKFEEVIDEFDELVDREYMYHEESNTTYWGYTVYEGKQLHDLDLLLISRENEFHNPRCAIYGDRCYTDETTLDWIIDDLMTEEGYEFPAIDIDDVDEDWVWRDMVEEVA